MEFLLGTPPKEIDRMKTVEQAIMRHQSSLDDYDAHLEAIEEATVLLVNKYWKEYKSTGRVDDLDLNEREITFLAIHRSIASHREIVDIETRKAVDEKPAVYLSATLEWN